MLRGSYAMCGTDLGYGATRRAGTCSRSGSASWNATRFSYAVRSTDLRCSYAMSGADIHCSYAVRCTDIRCYMLILRYAMH